MEAAGVPVARWRRVDADTTAEELVTALGTPLVLKPCRDSGGRGQRRFDDRTELASALVRLRDGDAFARGFGWLAEGWVDGVEQSVEAFVAGGEVVFLNPTEYLVPRHANVVPAPLEEELSGEVRTLTERALRTAGVERGIAHLELFRTDAGLVFGELAIRPPGGRLMTLLRRAWGFDPWGALLRLELGRSTPFPAAPRRTAGVWILHPGPGEVAAIHGLEEARAVPGVRRVVLKTAVGATIEERTGSGQDVGAIYAEGASRDAVATALELAHRKLRIELR
jgi:biotin carboxylase